MAVSLSHILSSDQLQLGQELLQGGSAVAVPAGWLTRSPLHYLLLQDPLDSIQRDMVHVLRLARGCFEKQQFLLFYLPVLKLCCSCPVCATIHQLLWLKTMTNF